MWAVPGGSTYENSSKDNELKFSGKNLEPFVYSMHNFHYANQDTLRTLHLAGVS